jgi:GNAT superfamily N-acetyltransferase
MADLKLFFLISWCSSDRFPILTITSIVGHYCEILQSNYCLGSSNRTEATGRRCNIMSNTSIKNATQADAERCLAVLALAFGGDPACRWAWPEPQQYLEAFPRFAQAFGGNAFNLGTAYYHGAYSRVALWLPPGTRPDEESLMVVIDDTVAHKLKDAMFLMFEQMDSYHPREAHWHLPLMGVDPARQGGGIGSALLNHVLKESDRQKVLAYLEATSPRNVPLYERYGFEALGTIQVADSPPIVPILRKPL